MKRSDWLAAAALFVLPIVISLILLGSVQWVNSRRNGGDDYQYEDSLFLAVHVDWLVVLAASVGLSVVYILFRLLWNRRRK